MHKRILALADQCKHLEALAAPAEQSSYSPSKQSGRRRTAASNTVGSPLLQLRGLASKRLSSRAVSMATTRLSVLSLLSIFSMCCCSLQT